MVGQLSSLEMDKEVKVEIEVVGYRDVGCGIKSGIEILRDEPSTSCKFWLF